MSIRNSLQLTAALAAAGVLSAGLAGAKPYGIDVSNNNGPVNWNSVRSAGVVFAWAKATEGTYFTDGYFAGNMKNGKNAGIYMGAYDFARPDLSSASTEANYFWNVAGSTVKADGKTLMPVLDIETFNGHAGASSYGDWANQWCNAIVNKASAKGLSAKPVIYTSSCSACNISGISHSWGAWLANYNGENPQSGDPWNICTSCEVWGSGQWDFWQYGDCRTLSGISGCVDADVFNGTTSQMLNQFLVGGSYQAAVDLKPSPISYANGHRIVFATQDNGAAPWDAHTTGVSGNGTWTGEWLGDNNAQMCASAVVPVLNANGYMEIFCVGDDLGYLRHKWNTGEGTAWSAWQTVGVDGANSYVGNPAVIVRPDGGVELFVHNDNGGSVQHFYHGSFSVTWSDDSLGGSIGSDCSVIINANGYMEVFATDANGNLVHRWNTGPGTAWNSGGWVSLGGGNKGRPCVIARTDGGVEVFVRKSDDSVNHYYHSSFSDAWNSGSVGGTVASNITGVQNANGHLEIFAITSDGNLWHNWNNGTGTPWNGWAHITLSVTLQSDPTAIVNSDGTTEVYGRDAANSNVGHTYNNGGSWTAWSSLGGPG
jgi:GH25 family lysozyme M1 (1,4-beta-N-acetylmuramidase)